MRKFLIYCMCGGIGVSTDFVVFYLTLSGGLWYQFANAVGYASGTLVSFFLNRKFTFEVNNRIIYRLILFFVSASIGYVVSAVLFWLMVEYYNQDKVMSKVIILPIVVLIQFSINKKITFKN